jgi:NDP-sugar pyrophosphorylase family protein
MEKFFQYGTPEDLKDWEYLNKVVNFFLSFTETDSNLPEQEKRIESAIILAGGIGSRMIDFSQTPKPFIKINNKEIWKYSRDAAANSGKKVFILRKEFEKYFEIDKSQTDLKILEIPTRGQADTAKYALNNISDLNGPITFFSCDNLISRSDYENAINLIEDSDLIVWVAKEYPMAFYQSSKYSWVDIDNRGQVSKFSLKTLPENFIQPAMVTGNFTFKNKELAINLIDECFSTAERYNSEIYLDSVIQIALEFGYKVVALNLDRFFAIGTEDELKTFLYFGN